MELTKEQIRILNRYKRSPSFFQSRNLDKIVQKLQATGLSKNEAQSLVFSSSHKDIKVKLLDMFYPGDHILHFDSWEYCDLWKELEPQVQQEYMNKIFSLYKNNRSNFPMHIWEKTDKDVQEYYMKQFIDIITEKEDELGLYGLWRFTESSVQNKNWNLINNGILPEDMLYKLSNSELQSKLLIQSLDDCINSEDDKRLQSKIGLFLQVTKTETFDKAFTYLFDDLKNNFEYLSHFLMYSPKSVREKQSSKIKEYFCSNLYSCIGYCQDTKSWRLCLEFAKYFDAKSAITIIENMIIDDSRNYINFFIKMDEDKQKEIFEICIKDNKLNDNLSELFHLMKFENFEDAKLYFSKYLEKYNQEKKDVLIDKLEKIYKKNNNITSTINFSFLESDMIDFLTEEQILRITNYPKVQRTLVEHKENKNFINVFASILKTDENWTLAADYMLNICDFWENKQLLLDISKNGISPEYYDTLCLILSQFNYFEITSIEDVEKYFDADGKRNQMLLSIMRGDDIELPDILKYSSQVDLKKFAVLEYLYGIDLEKSNKYEKWFQGINGLELEGDKYEYIKTLITGITSLNNANTEELDKIITDIIEGRKQPTEYIKDIHLESKAVNLFGEAFEIGIYNPQKSENDKIQSIEYNGSSIDVYRIHNDFKMFARVEGAYSYLPPIPDYRKFYDSPYITAHGNCESIIGQDQIGLARNIDGNIVPGYALVPKNSILLSAPYDLASSSSNETIAPLHEGLSLEFYNLQEMIDNTRHTHNETVMERVLVDEHGNVQKLKPNYLIWIEDRKIDKFPPEFTESSKKSQVHLWEETQRAAHELGIPIVIINREECAERENEEIEHLKKILRGEEELPEGKDLADIAREAIIKFENNVVGLEFAEDDVRFKYFTPTQREDLMKVVMDVLERMPETAYEERVEYLTKIADGIKQESTKFSVGSKTVDLSLIEYYDSKAKEISEKLVEYEKYIGKGSMINFDISEEIKTMFETDIRAIANTDYYKDNKAHSIEHIEKVMLFSLILAQNEELDESDTKILLASAAFHDSFRAGNDGNGPHAAGSAIRAKEYFEGNENNSYGINKNDIPLIQVAIAYHEYEEKIPGKVDREQIGKLCEEYGYTGDFEKVVQISSILKDADALDRERFAARGKLNPDLLRTDSAKSDEMILLAQKVNGMYAKKMIERNYKVDKKIDIFNAVRILRDQRYKNRNMITETTLSVDEMLQLFDEIVNEHTSDVDKKRTKRSGLEGCMDDGKLRSGQAEKAIEAVNIAIRSKTSEISIQDEIDEDEQAE